MSVAIVIAQNYELPLLRKAVRDGLVSLGYDKKNPLGKIVKPGNRVFIKPNWVAHCYRASCLYQDSIWSTITHPAIIRVTVELVAIALKGKGQIIIGDNPSIDADFDKLREIMGLDDLEKPDNSLGVPVRILDLRPLCCVDLHDYGQKDKMTKLPGDPAGYRNVDLGEESLLNGLSSRLFRGVFTDCRETVKRHSGSRQEYEFSRSIIDADVYISLPKMKTHCKVGTTLNLKGLVGTVSNKNLLVHWRKGFPLIGGDAYPSFWAWFSSHFKMVQSRGAWSGNDTIWRMVVDLYTAFTKIGPKRCFSIVDGVIGGQGDGPFCPRSKDGRRIVLGDDLLCVDAVTTRLMGFNLEAVPYFRHFLKTGKLDPSAIKLIGLDRDIEDFWKLKKAHLGFVGPTHWQHMTKGGKK